MCENKGWVFPLFSPDSDDRLTLNFHRFVISYISCDTRSVGLGQHCLLKVSTGFKRSVGNAQWAYREVILTASIKPYIKVIVSSTSVKMLQCTSCDLCAHFYPNGVCWFFVPARISRCFIGGVPFKVSLRCFDIIRSSGT